MRSPYMTHRARYFTLPRPLHGSGKWGEGQALCSARVSISDTTGFPTHATVPAGMRQSFVTVGSLGGSAVASMIFYLSGQSYVATFAAASVPPCLALVWLAVAFRKELGPAETPPVRPEPSRGGGSDRGAAMVESTPSQMADGESGKQQPQLSWLQKIQTVISSFSPAYWQALLVVSVLYFGRFDFTWVTLRAKAVLPLPLA